MVLGNCYLSKIDIFLFNVLLCFHYATAELPDIGDGGPHDTTGGIVTPGEPGKGVGGLNVNDLDLSDFSAESASPFELRVHVTQKVHEVARLAVNFATSYGHKEVTPAHLLRALIHDKTSLCHQILTDCSCQMSKLAEGFKKLVSTFPTFSKDEIGFVPRPNAKLILIFQRAINEADMNRDGVVGLDHLILAAIVEEEIMNLLKYAGVEKSCVENGILEMETSNVTDPTAKEEVAPFDIEPLLKLGARDLTEAALNGELEDCYYKEKLTKTVIEILARLRKNNVIIRGDPGVGKTNLVHGLAHRIVEGNVPRTLQNRKIMELSMGTLMSGTSYRGQLEEKIKNMIDSLRNHKKRVILFIDEIHQLMGGSERGEQGGGGDIANQLKTALTGDLSVIGATTLKEYRKITKDLAFARRFTVVDVPEATIEETIAILRSIKDVHEKYTGVIISDEAIIAAPKMAKRHCGAQSKLPDSARDLLDSASAKVMVERELKPSEIEDMENKIFRLESQIDAIKKDLDFHSKKRREQYQAEVLELKEKLHPLLRQYEKEKKLITELGKVKERHAQVIRGIHKATVQKDKPAMYNLGFVREPALRRKVDAKLKELEEFRKTYTTPLVKEKITKLEIAMIVSEKQKIPLEQLVENESQSLLRCKGNIQKKIVGMQTVIQRICHGIMISSLNLGTKTSPIVSVFLLGPTGVGKTRLPKQFSYYIGYGRPAMIRIDMSEYQDPASYTKLIGASPGYVGYDDGGALTERLRETPYSVLLFDEIEKGCKAILNLCLQLIDEGSIKDGGGLEVLAIDTLFFMTSNLGAHVFSNYFNPTDSDKERISKSAVAKKQVAEIAKQHISPELWNRIGIIYISGLLTRAMMKMILQLMFGEISEVLNEQYVIELFVEKKVSDWIIEFLFSPLDGARLFNKFIQDNITANIAQLIIEKNITYHYYIAVRLHPRYTDKLLMSYTPKTDDGEKILNKTKNIEITPIKADW